jgi:hypothetical protein
VDHVKIPKKLLKKLFALSNVQGVGYGNMTKCGETRGKGIVVTVSKKIPETELHARDVIPRTLNGEAVDVIEVGEIKALQMDRTAKYRPFPMGVSVGHKDITAGTAGCIVHKNGEKFLLSNNHVLANVNSGSAGDHILQPGPYDGGKDTPEYIVGTLAEYVKIKFPSCLYSVVLTQILNFLSFSFGSTVTFNYSKKKFSPSTANKVDCALAKLVSDIANDKIVDLGYINNIGVAKVGDTVWKSGRTTSTKSGPIALTNYITQVNMGEKGNAYFDDQYLVNQEGFSSGGDSGSAVIRKDGDCITLVGLLFAGSDKVTVVNKIQNVFDLLDITL